VDSVPKYYPVIFQMKTKGNTLLCYVHLTMTYKKLTGGKKKSQEK